MTFMRKLVTNSASWPCSVVQSSLARALCISERSSANPPVRIWGWSPYWVNQASVGWMPMRCIPGTNSRTTNSKYSCSRPGRISQVISSLTVTEEAFGNSPWLTLPLPLHLKQHHLRAIPQPALGDLQVRQRLQLADPHFGKEPRNRPQLHR